MPKEILITIILAIIQIPIGIIGGTMPQPRSKVPPISSAASILLILALLALYWQEIISQNSVLYGAIALTALAIVIMVIYILRQKESKEKLQDTAIQSLNNVVTKESLSKALEGMKRRGKLENISPLEKDWILAKSLEMTWVHGHEDFFQLLAEIADDIPLSELMTRPCSRCGVPRNQKGKPLG